MRCIRHTKLTAWATALTIAVAGAVLPAVSPAAPAGGSGGFYPAHITTHPVRHRVRRRHHRNGPITCTKVVDCITWAADEFHQSPAAAIAVANCESGLRPGITAYNGYGEFQGMWMFENSTWDGSILPGWIKSHSVYDPYWSSVGAMWMWAHGWQHAWTCYTKLYG